MSKRSQQVVLHYEFVEEIQAPPKSIRFKATHCLVMKTVDSLSYSVMS